MNERGGFPHDLVRGYRGTSINGTGQDWGPRGYKTAGASGSVSFAGVPDEPFLRTSGLTILWRGIRTSTTGGFAAVTKTPGTGAASSGGQQTPFDFGSQDASNLTLVRSMAAASSYRSWRPNFSGSLPPIGDLTQIVVTTPDNLVQTQPAWYINDDPAIGSAAGAFTTASTGAASGGAGAGLIVGMRGDAGTGLTGETHLLLIWSRSLTPAEIALLWAEPYAFMQPPPSRGRLYSINAVVGSIPTGTGAGTWAWVGAASGTRTSKATTAGTWAWAGAAAGTKVSKGTTAGTLSYVGAATGTKASQGTTSGIWTWTGAAAGSAPGVGVNDGTGAGTWAFTGAAAGKATPRGTTAGSWTFLGAAAGTTTKRGTAAGTWAYVGTAAGSNAGLDYIVHRPDTGTVTRPTDGTVTRPRTYA